MTVLGKPFMSALIGSFDAIASALNGLATFLNGPVGQGLMAALSPLVSLSEAGAALANATGINGTDSTAQAPLKATQDNTKGLNNVAQRLDGTYGVDSDGRLCGAIPGSGAASADARNQNRRELAGNAIRLSAF